MQFTAAKYSVVLARPSQDAFLLPHIAYLSRVSKKYRYYRHLIAPSSSPDFSCKVVLNLALGLVTFYCSCKTEYWGPACSWMGFGSTSIGDSSKCHLGGSEGLKNRTFNSFSHSLVVSSNPLMMAPLEFRD